MPGQGIRWEWFNDVTWMAYDIPTSEAIEKEYSFKNTFIDLSRTRLGIPNVLDFHSMEQINKHTHFRRPVRRLTKRCYPTATLGLHVGGVSPSKSLNASANVNGYVASNNTRPLKSGVTAKGTKTVSKVKKAKRAKVENSQGTIFYFVTLDKVVVLEL